MEKPLAVAALSSSISIPVTRTTSTKTPLSKLDNLLLYYARITDKTLAWLDRCNIIVRHAVGRDNMDLDVVEQRVKSGQPGSLGTDVLPTETPVDHPLIRAWRDDAPWLRNRLFITPHTAFYSEKALYDMRFKAAETIALFFEKNELRNQIV